VSTEDLLLPDGIGPDAVGEALSHRLHISARDDEIERDRTFYDTFDGLLHAAGLSAVHERGRLSVLGSDNGAVPEAAWASPPRRLLAIELEPGPLRDALVPVVDVRALLARARVRSRSRRYDVLDDAGKTVVRLELELPALVASELREIPLSPRVRLIAVRGYDRELRRARVTLEEELGFSAARRPLVDEAVRAAGGRPSGQSSTPKVTLKPTQRADAAAVLVLRALYEVMQANLEGTIADVDSEFLHDFRVALRRTRAVLRELQAAFAADERTRLRAELKWLQRATGDARDLDVYVLDFESMRSLVPEQFGHDLDPLLGVLRSRRLTARREMVRVLRSDRALALWRDWEAFLDTAVSAPGDDRPAAAEPIGKLVGMRIGKVYRRMVKMGRAIDDESPPEALHELRKKGKELRYLLELFGRELYPDDVVKPMIKTLKALQDVLGRHQDREVQAATLRSLREEVSALPGGSAALMAMGLLVERVGEDQLTARRELGEVFGSFASKAQRKLVKETFG
jgi:CHAD domain-containing protein